MNETSITTKFLSSKFKMNRGMNKKNPANTLNSVKARNPLTGLMGRNKIEIDPTSSPTIEIASRIPK